MARRHRGIRGRLVTELQCACREALAVHPRTGRDLTRGSGKARKKRDDPGVDHLLKIYRKEDYFLSPSPSMTTLCFLRISSNSVFHSSRAILAFSKSPFATFITSSSCLSIASTMSLKASS